MMQAASDIFLGWTKGADRSRHFYWRQLRDMKGSAEVESMAPVGLGFYAGICGWTLARAHARSGDPVAIAEYLGDSDAFDTSITDFSQRYADQNERDYQEFVNAIRSGRLQALQGV
jgi:predicted alpha/beta hydrolase